MRTKHIPMRTCVGCRQNRAKRDLVRVVRTPEGRVELDLSGKKSGRGAYLCPTLDCLQKAIAGRQLERALQCGIDAEVKISLEKELHEQNV